MTADQFLRPSRFSPARIEALDRRNAAVHEAGHKVIARHVGVTAFNAEIWRNHDAGKDGRTWLGNIRVERSPRISRLRMAMVAVAGAIAEYVWSGEADFLENEGELAWHEEAIMSPTDWDMAACAPGEPNAAFMRAVDKVLVLLRDPLRAELYASSRSLIVESRTHTIAAA
jgi:hypothetical protein